jgi:hypothetical protein
MEERRGPTPPENNDDDETQEKAFVSSWLRRLETENNTPEEEDDDEEESPMPKGWRRLWHKLFKKMEEQPAEESKDLESNNPKTDEEAPWQPADNPDYEPIYPMPEQTEADYPLSGEHDSSVIEAPATPAEQLENLTSEATAASPEISVPEPEAVNIIETTGDLEPVLPDERVINLQGGPSEAPSVVYERTKETIDRNPDNRAVATTAVLLGAEFLARRRGDRRLKREVERLNRKVQKGAEASKKLEQIVHEVRTSGIEQKQPRQTLGTPEMRPIASQRTAEVRPEAVVQPPPVESLRQVRTEVERVEKAVQASRERIQPPVQPEKSKPEAELRNIEKITEKEELEVPARSEVILEKVVDAAEHNIPIERSYERRHEIKDEATSPMGAHSIGSILTGVTSPVISSGMQSTTHLQNNPILNVPSSQPQQPEMYKQAIQRGFVGAAVLLVLMAIAYIATQL